MKVVKLKEFNFKILHNILPTGIYINKWNKNISKYCEACTNEESMKHMLYDCNRIQIIWKIISQLIMIEIKWKHLVCFLPQYSTTLKTSTLNFIITIVCYAIFKANSKAKFENSNYRLVNIKQEVKHNLLYYTKIMSYISEQYFLKTVVSKVVTGL